MRWFRNLDADKVQAALDGVAGVIASSAVINRRHHHHDAFYIYATAVSPGKLPSAAWMRGGHWELC